MPLLQLQVGGLATAGFMSAAAGTTDPMLDDDRFAIPDSVTVRVPNERIGQEAEELLAVGDTITIRVPDPGVGEIDVDLIAVGHSVAIDVWIVRIEPGLQLQRVDIVVPVGVFRAGDGRVGSDRLGGLYRLSHIFGCWFDGGVVHGRGLERA